MKRIGLVPMPKIISNFLACSEIRLVLAILSCVHALEVQFLPWPTYTPEISEWMDTYKFDLPKLDHPPKA